MNNENKIKELISRYIDGEVTLEEKETVERLIKEDASFLKYYKELKELDKLLNTIPADKTSQKWENTVSSALLETHKKEELEMNKKINIKKSRTSNLAVAAVFVLFVLVTAVIVTPVVKRSSQARLSIAKNIERDNEYRRVISKIKKTEPSSGKGKEREEFANLSGSALKNNIGDEIVRSGAKKKHALNGEKAQGKRERLEKLDQLSLKCQRGDTSLKYKAPMSKSITKGKSSRLTEYKAEDLEYDLSDKFAGDPKAWAPIASISNEGMMQPYEEKQIYRDNFNTEEYARVYENEFMYAKDNPLSTFSIDVDTASYSNIRRYLTSSRMPPEDSVRVEEMINYFTYAYPQPDGNDPFSITINGSVCPWNKENRIVKIGIQGKKLNADELPPSNLVFLMDVSGSMNSHDKLPLLKKAFKMLVKQLSDDERVAIVVYAGAAGMVLDSTPGSNRHMILSAIDRLNAGGSTAGGAGIKLAYKIAKDNFIKGGNNRVILATDGDFNIGVSSTGDLTRLIEEKREEGIALTVLGFGTGNLKDSRMEQLANKGNGNYYYIDTIREAKKVLVSELGSTLFTIAKDVKLQIEFNPSKVKSYRLVGYENRILAKEDFNDDTKDAGELGAGHTVTAFYEIVPADSKEDVRKADELIYQQTKVVTSNDVMTVKLRYKKPDEDKSKLIKKAITEEDISSVLKDDFQFAASVAEFGLLLKNSKFKGTATYESIIKSAENSKGKDSFGYRNEFINLVKKAQALDYRVDTEPSKGIQFKGE